MPVRFGNSLSSYAEPVSCGSSLRVEGVEEIADDRAAIVGFLHVDRMFGGEQDDPAGAHFVGVGPDDRPAELVHPGQNLFRGGQGFLVRPRRFIR